MTQYEKFIAGLDADRPDWFIFFATQQELAECVRLCTDGRSGTVKAKNALRREVSERLFSVVRAAYNGGMVEFPVAKLDQVIELIQHGRCSDLNIPDEEQRP